MYHVTIQHIRCQILPVILTPFFFLELIIYFFVHIYIYIYIFGSVVDLSDSTYKQLGQAWKYTCAILFKRLCMVGWCMDLHKIWNDFFFRSKIFFRKLFELALTFDDSRSTKILHQTILYVWPKEQRMYANYA